MQPAPPAAELLAAIPGIAARLALILGNLAALVARAFLRHPVHVAHIVPLWNYIGRTARRFARSLDRLATGTSHPSARQRGRRPTTAGAPRTPRGYPATRAWLRAALAQEANALASQLTHLLDQPDTRALLAAAPQAARILRPICHFLGIQPDSIRRPPRPPAQSRPAKPVPLRLARRHAAPADAPAALFPRPLAPLCPRLAERWPFAPRSE